MVHSMAAMPRWRGKQRGMIADAAEFRGGQRVLADAGVAVRRDDQVGARGDFGSDHQFWIGLHGDFNSGGFRRRGQPVFGIGHDHPCDLDAVFAQHVQGHHAKMAGADEGDPHAVNPSVGRCPSIACGSGCHATDTPDPPGYQQGAPTQIVSVLAALPANRDEGHETWLGQRVAPAMAGSVLHDAIALAQMDLLSVVQLQRHLATNHDPIIDGVRVCMPGALRSKWSPMPGTFSVNSCSALSKVTPGGGL